MPKKCHSGLWLWDRQHTEQKRICPRSLCDVEDRARLVNRHLRASFCHHPKVSWTKRRWPGPGRSLSLSLCQRLGSASQPRFGSGPGPACLIEAPVGEKKRSSTHKLIPNAEGVVSETDIKKAESLDSWHEWHLWKREKKGRETWKLLKFYNCEFVVHLMYCSGQTATVMEHMALQRTLGRRGHDVHSLGTTLAPDWDAKTWTTAAAHVKDYCTFLTKGGTEGMNNIIKRRQDWQERNCCREKRNEHEVNVV